MLKIVYIGGCFLPWLMTMCVLRLCQIQVSRRVRLVTLLCNAAVYPAVLTIGHTTLFYRKLTLEKAGDIWIQHKVYGPFHSLYYICILLFLAADLIAIFYSYRVKRQVSRRILFLLFIPIPVSMMGYFANRHFLQIGYELMPLTYALAQFVYLLIAHRMALYNVSEMVIESEVQFSERPVPLRRKKERRCRSMPKKGPGWYMRSSGIRITKPFAASLKMWPITTTSGWTDPAIPRG